MVLLSKTMYLKVIPKWYYFETIPRLVDTLSKTIYLKVIPFWYYFKTLPTWYDFKVIPFGIIFGNNGILSQAIYVKVIPFRYYVRKQCIRK